MSSFSPFHFKLWDSRCQRLHYYRQTDYNSPSWIVWYGIFFLFVYLTWTIGSSINQLHSYLFSKKKNYTHILLPFGKFCFVPHGPHSHGRRKDITFMKRQKSTNSFCFIFSWHALELINLTSCFSPKNRWIIDVNKVGFFFG